MQGGCHEGLNPEFIRGKRVCLTGRFVSMTQADLAELVRALGGRFVRNPPRGSALLVIGDEAWPARRDGAPTKILRRARQLRARGYPIQLLSETEFFEKLGLQDRTAAVRRHLPLAELARMLGVPAVKIRRWMHLGLVEPAETVHRFSLFDFHQVANAKKICELVGHGVALAEIRRGLQRVHQWLPDRDLPFSQLAMLEHDGRLLVRLRGTVFEPTGQMRFNFEAAGDEEAGAVLTPRSPRDSRALFDRALALEDAGNLEQAADAYREAITLEPANPVLHFNLGNVLFALGEPHESAESYRHALRHDPCYAEAWNNLGIACAKTEAWQQAIQAFRRAIQLLPDYDDARWNLSSTLTQIGRARNTRVLPPE